MKKKFVIVRLLSYESLYVTTSEGLLSANLFESIQFDYIEEAENVIQSLLLDDSNLCNIYSILTVYC